MCNFLSAIVMRNGDILSHPEYSDSHSFLERMYLLRDGRHQVEAPYARVEMVPPKDLSLIQDLSTWKLTIDEQRTPVWFDEDMIHRVRTRIEHQIKRMFVTDKRDLLVGGCYILLDGAVVEQIQQCRVFAIVGTAKVERIEEGTRVDNIGGDACVRVICGRATVTKIGGRASISGITGRASVGDIIGSVHVEHIYGEAKVGYISGGTTIDSIYGTANIGSISENAKVGRIGDSANVTYIYGKSTVGSIEDHAQVRYIQGDAVVGEIGELVIVDNDARIQR